MFFSKKWQKKGKIEICSCNYLKESGGKHLKETWGKCVKESGGKS